MVKNSLCRARDMCLIPGQGTKIPHAAGQLSQGATTEPARLEPRLRNKRSHCNGKPVQQGR